jgi:hypothetical protein
MLSKTIFPNSRLAGGDGRPVQANKRRETPRAHLESIGGVGRCRHGSGEGVRRWSAVAAVAGCGSDEGDGLPGHGRRLKPLRILGGV